ncbi:MAG: EAL domain-containing protein, partial [Rhodobacteraceae bacterium]
MARRDADDGVEPVEIGAESPLDAAVSERDRNTLAMVRKAIAERNVVLAFQPVVQASRPTSAAFYEGLVRVLDDRGRVIPARNFIETIETTELGRVIDCLALEMGLISLAEDPGLRLAINMSARSIG